MRTESSQVAPGDPGTERILIFLLLRDDRRRWSLADIEADLYDVAPDAIRGSVAYLAAVGVAALNGETVEASAATRRIDALCDIAV
ncbi:MAG TPA: hypothetical protein VGL37_01695 [Solirubrobacteraceae bacterium]|jgi:hypothetical protein